MEEQKHQFKGVFIPKEIWLDTELNILDKAILTEIYYLDDDEKGCYASNKYLAEFCQCTETKVSTAISKLKKLGYIEQTDFDGRHRKLKVKSKSLPLKNLKSDIKNFKSNNINNNIKNNILLSKDNNIENLENSQTNTKKNFINDYQKSLEDNNKQRQKSKKITKQTIAIKRVNLIDNYTQDEDVKKLLLKYLNIRRIKGLDLDQWEIMLETFFNKYTTKSSQLEQINNAYLGNWMSLVYENTFNGNIKTSYSSNKYQDNCANHDTSNQPKFNEMTKEQKEKWMDENLAKDENGNFLVF